MKICTYFDSGYQSRGAALLSSSEMADRAILLLDDAVSAKQMTMSQPQRLSKFLESHKAIALITASRSGTERIFSVGPSFLLSQMSTLSPKEWLVYDDADLYFFRPLEEYLAAFDDANVILAPHRHFAWNKKTGEVRGIQCRAGGF